MLLRLSLLPRVIFAALLSVILTVPVLAAIEGLPRGCEPIDGQFLGLVLTGNTMSGVNARTGKNYREYLSSNGKAVLETSDGRILTGQWRLAKRGICFRYGKGDWDCKAMGMSECSGGKHRYSFLKLVDGKPTITGHVSKVSEGDAFALVGRKPGSVLEDKQTAKAASPAPDGSPAPEKRMDVSRAGEPCAVTAKRQTILNIFANNTYFGVNAKSGLQFQEFLKSDSRSYAKRSDGKVLEGKWKVEGDSICFDYGKGASCKAVALLGCTKGGYVAAFAVNTLDLDTQCKSTVP